MEAIVVAGIPATNMTLYHQIRFVVGDPTAWINFGGGSSLLLVRDIEMERAKKHARAEVVACPNDFVPEGGLSGNRELATAQALAECLVQRGVTRITGDRSLALVFVDQLLSRGIQVDCDYDLGLKTRRTKDQEEQVALRDAQATTELAMRHACELIANADALADGTLTVDGEPLTSERVRADIDLTLLQHGYTGSPSIVAGGPQGSDCHELGKGILRTSEPIIVDIFPRNNSTLYHGDCTRTVVHGEIPEDVRLMHAAVAQAKAASQGATRAGATGQSVHEATIAVIQDHGFSVGLPGENESPSYCGMVHGTGHGIGLEVHEAPLLDMGGPELVVGDAVTIEPGVYSKAIGGVRIEDMVLVSAEGCENLNTLPEGLDWT
jgi:Xaa-Pro aminopeptidase